MIESRNEGGAAYIGHDFPAPAPAPRYSMTTEREETYVRIIHVSFILMGYFIRGWIRTRAN